MEIKNKDFFANKAEHYEKEQKRVDNVTNIAKLILQEMKFTKDMHIMDFGSGTGLLLSQIAPYVDKITAVDMSKSMNEVLVKKVDNLDCIVEIKEIDLSKNTLNMKFDSIISSMTIHHVKNIKHLFTKFHDMLNVGGTIALSDLDSENGTFHKEDTGVYHFGFNRDEFIKVAQSVGFCDLKIQTVGKVVKPYGEYGIFLLIGKKQGD